MDVRSLTRRMPWMSRREIGRKHEHYGENCRSRPSCELANAPAHAATQIEPTKCQNRTVSLAIPAWSSRIVKDIEFWLNLSREQLSL